MNGTTFVLIFFFWAALTVITPTLVSLSESAKAKEKLDSLILNARIKDRRLIGYAPEPHPQSRNTTIPLNPYNSSSPAPAPAPAPTEAELSPRIKQYFEQRLFHRKNKTGDFSLQKPLASSQKVLL